MQKIMEQPTPKEALVIREVLSNLGFNPTLLASEKYVLNKLRSLPEEELQDVRRVFIKNGHLLFMKERLYHQPYGKRQLYKHSVEKSNLKKLAKLIHVTAFLLQTKVTYFGKILP